jgi:Membrane proteins related to metalloendopeptidases
MSGQLLPGYLGTDIKTCAKDTIRVAFDGVVRMAKPYYAYGNIVVIRHANGLETLYSHNFKNLVKSGDIAKAGQPVGLTGRTGRVTTGHVHFETRINGEHFNPNLIFNLKEGALRKECIRCTGNGSKIVVKTYILD